MTTDQVHAAVVEPVKQCAIALDQQKPIGHGLEKNVRLPSGRQVYTSCRTDEDGTIVVWITTDPLAPAAKETTQAARDVALVNPLLDECGQALKHDPKHNFLTRKFSVNGRNSTIEDTCMREGAGTTVMLQWIRKKP